MKYLVFIVTDTECSNIKNGLLSCDEVAVIEASDKCTAEIAIEVLAQIDIKNFIEYKSAKGDKVIRVIQDMIDGVYCSCEVEHQGQHFIITYVGKDIDFY